ncbi:MAG: hypothetical protein ACFFC7_20930, partial [Candidatus Hermodarchaeota archaeon]
ELSTIKLQKDQFEAELKFLKQETGTLLQVDKAVRELLNETERGPVFLRLVEINHEVDLDTLAESLGQPAALVRRHIQYMADQDILEFDDENRTIKLK